MNVPSRIKMSQWKEILELDSPGKRRRYYNFLFLNEMKAQNFKAKKLQQKEDRFRELEETGNLWGPKEDDHFGVTYGLGRNTLFLRLYDTTVSKFHHNKVVSAMQFGRPLVLDCGYDEFMSPREAKNCAKQVEILLTLNRNHNQPFNLHLCNVAPDSRMMGYLEKIIPTIRDDAYPLIVTEQSYLNLFPKKELVYLSPHAKEELEEYDENEIYIIGGMVDKSDPRPFSLAKAKKENVRMKKLPLDKYLVWGMGNKSLTLNQMISIMLELRLCGDWKKAFDHVPKRKLNRDYHPYPDQIDDRQFEPSQPFSQQSPRRREQKSQVLEDFDLQNRRHKGFKGNPSQENYAVRSNNYPSRDFGRSNNTRINARSLFEKE
jgi:ribonuclease P protein 1